MATSQVEIVSLRPSFGRVLRDRNRRHNDDDDVVFQKNLKGQVKSASLESAAISDENCQNRVDYWIGNKPKKKNKSRLESPETPRCRKRNKFSDSPKQSTNVSRRERSKNDNFGGASSLVQIWEARLNRSDGGNSPIYGQPTESSLGASVQEETSFSAPSTDGESESKNGSEITNRTVEIDSGTPNSGESKLGGVADIIRRLKTTAGDKGGAIDIPIVKRPMQEKSSSFPVVTCSPRLAGRQAFSDLLQKLQRDRNRELESLLERNAVSRFPQRRRLQSMLRLRSLKRGLVIQDRHRFTAKPPDLNRQESGSTVLHLREKFRENEANAAAEAEQTNVETERSTETIRSKEISNLLKTPSTERLSIEETESNMRYLQLKETIVAETLKSKADNTILSISAIQEPQILESEKANNVESSIQRTQETPFLEKQETSFLEKQETPFLEKQETKGWDEQEEYEDEQSYYEDMSYDWFTEISRPRTYWEDLRKLRYLEVMNTRSDKDDICKLLDRRTVSGFLESGLRENIDKLLMSRVQTHPVQQIEETVKEEEQCDIAKEDEDRDDLSQTSSQIFAPSPAGSWSSHDTGITSKPLNNLHSTEMETINDLRSQILQLQQEMSELRDSVKTCLDVNASLQKSVLYENPLRRRCCVCTETHVEALLYRCGHMCTCLRCANELQCNGGKCPICHAKILDVVRVFV